MDIFLIRHGESEAAAGSSEEIDCALTAAGLAQAGAVAAALAPGGVTRILSSPFRRCLQTAEVLRRVTGAPAELYPALHEHHHAPYPPGDWPLPGKSEIAAAFPDFAVPRDMPETHWAAVPEDRDRFWKRISAAAREVLLRFGGRGDARVALVTHGAAASVFVQAFCQWPNPLRVGVQVDPGSISILRVEPDGRRVLAKLNWLPQPLS